MNILKRLFSRLFRQKEWTLAIWITNETGKWQHLAITRKFNQTIFYIDGKRCESQQGSLKGLVVFERVLLPSEIAKLYDGERQ